MYLRVSNISNPRNCSERKKLKKRLRELRENEKEDKVYEHRERERERERESFILIFGRRKKLSDKVRTL